MSIEVFVETKRCMGIVVVVVFSFFVHCLEKGYDFL
jgi:hypothetical protein